jgi:hypothetical protein
MIRKLLVVAAAIAMPVSAVAVTGGMASASGSHGGSAATDTIVCTKITGKVVFSPKVDKTGYTNMAIKSTVTATLSGCTVKGTFVDHVTSGSVTGSLTGTKGTVAKPAGKCSGLIGSNADVGALSTKWAASPAVPNSVLNVKSVSGGTHGAFGTFTIPGTVKGTAAGSFEGTDHGAKDKSVAQTVATAASLITTCDSSGLSTLSITTDSAAPAVSLG